MRFNVCIGFVHTLHKGVFQTPKLLTHSCKDTVIDTQLWRTEFFRIVYIILCVCNSRCWFRQARNPLNM